MNDNNELYTKAKKAARDYRAVHGSFPKKIGIHYKRLQSFHYRRIVFTERTELPSALFLAEEPPSFESIRCRQHIAYFQPVLGEAIEYDEVYLPIPGEERGVISATQLGYLAAEQERDKKFFLATGRRLRKQR